MNKKYHVNDYWYFEIRDEYLFGIYLYDKIYFENSRNRKIYLFLFYRYVIKPIEYNRLTTQHIKSTIIFFTFKMQKYNIQSKVITEYYINTCMTEEEYSDYRCFKKTRNITEVPR